MDATERECDSFSQGAMMLVYWGLMLVDPAMAEEQVEAEVVRALARFGPAHDADVRQQWTSYRLHLETLRRVSEWDECGGWYALLTPNGRWTSAGSLIAARPDFDLEAAFEDWRNQMMDALATHMNDWSVEVHARFGWEAHYPWEDEEPLRPTRHAHKERGDRRPTRLEEQ
ncbi:MAG: hypothetical protein ACRDHP_09245 [Ktedonobacterales bacterium]